jgi:hypothetical protein
MTGKIYFTPLLLCAFIFAGTVVYGNENRGTENIKNQSHQVLHRLISKDKSVTAIWVGEDPRTFSETKDTPLEFGVKELIFKFSSDGKKYTFKPQGDLYFDCWGFNIFDEEGRYVVLLQSHYGPYHVVKVESLRDYLVGKSAPYEVVEGKDPDGTCGVVHEPLRWISSDTFEFLSAACGSKRVVHHKIGSETKRGGWK